MTADFLAAIAGITLSLAFSYIPGVKDEYGKLDRQYKQMIMGAMLLVAAVAIFALSCGSVVDAVSCDKPGAIGLATVFIEALIANQGVYLLTRR